MVKVQLRWVSKKKKKKKSAIKMFFLFRDRYGEVTEGSEATNSKLQVLGIKMNVMNFVDL